MTRLELPRTRRFEAAMVQRIARVLITSPRDRAALMALAQEYPAAVNASDDSHGPPILVLPNGVDIEYFSPAGIEEPPRGAPEQVIMTGKMSYHANVTGALHLVNTVMPLVWQHRPEVQVVLAGSAPARALRELADQYEGRVCVTGFVPDLRPHLRAATVAVAPITYGAGCQFKVLEAMACGVPVVASGQASSALAAAHDQDLIIAQTPHEFANAILRLLGSDRLRAKLCQAGRRYVIEHHNWVSITGRLEGYYAEAIGHGCHLRQSAEI